MSVTKREMEKLINRVARLESFVTKIAKHFSQLGKFDFGNCDDDEGSSSSDSEYLPQVLSGGRPQKLKRSKRKRKHNNKTSPTSSQNNVSNQIHNQHENHEPIYPDDQESMEIGPHSVKIEHDSEVEVEIYPYSSDFGIIPSDENNGLEEEEVFTGEALNSLETRQVLVPPLSLPQPLPLLNATEKRPNPKARDPVWTFFENVDETTRTWKCKLCGKEFKHAKCDRVRLHIQNKCVKKPKEENAAEEK